MDAMSPYPDGFSSAATATEECFGVSVDRPATRRDAPGALGSIAMKWAALHQAGQAVAAIAGVEPDRPSLAARAFPAIMREAGGWRCALAEQGIEDLTAIMEPGLAALLASIERGGDPRAAARSLWHEFVTARDAMVALAPPVALVEKDA